MACAGSHVVGEPVNRLLFTLPDATASQVHIYDMPAIHQCDGVFRSVEA